MPHITVPISNEGKARFEAHCQGLGEVPMAVRVRQLIFEDMRQHSDPLQVPMLTAHRQYLEKHFQARGTTLEGAMATMALKLYQQAKSNG